MCVHPTLLNLFALPPCAPPESTERHSRVIHECLRYDQNGACTPVQCLQAKHVSSAGAAQTLHSSIWRRLLEDVGGHIAWYTQHWRTPRGSHLSSRLHCTTPTIKQVHSILHSVACRAANLWGSSNTADTPTATGFCTSLSSSSSLSVQIRSVPVLFCIFSVRKKSQKLVASNQHD